MDSSTTISKSESFQRGTLASISLFVASSMILSTLKVIRSDHLELEHYLSNVFRRRASSEYPFDVVICATVTLTWSTAQFIFAVMFFFGEFRWRCWCWMNFGGFISYLISLYCMASASFSDPENGLKTSEVYLLELPFPQLGISIKQNFPSFHTLLYVNMFFTLFCILHSILIINLKLDKQRMSGFQKYYSSGAGY